MLDRRLGYLWAKRHNLRGVSDDDQVSRAAHLDSGWQLALRFIGCNELIDFSLRALSYFF